MNSRVPFLTKLSPDRLMVLVVLLGVSFVAIVLLPGLKLAGDLVNSSAALKWVADQQRYPTIIRASLETMRDRLTESRLSSGIGRPADRRDQEVRRCRADHDDAAARRLARHRDAGIGGRLDRRQPGRSAARCVGEGARRGAARARLQQRAVRGQRVGGHRAQCHRAAARARPDHRHPHQPPFAAGARIRADHRRRTAAGRQRARREAAPGRHARWAC